MCQFGDLHVDFWQRHWTACDLTDAFRRVAHLMLARTLRNQDVLLKFWVGISIQIFALCQVLEEPLLGWIPYAVFGNWMSRIWGVLSVYFYVKWLLQIKKWNEAYETKSDKTVARIFHPLMAPAMGSVVVMEVLTFVGSSNVLKLGA